MGHQFDADRGDLLKMQDEIVTRLARAMQIQLVAVDAARVTRTRPVISMGRTWLYAAKRACTTRWDRQNLRLRSACVTAR